jgi:hypothetical protein
MKKSELLSALQNEIQRHNLSTFMSAEHKIVQTGCSPCQKHFGTVEQFKRHITEDVLPPLLDRLSSDNGIASVSSQEHPLGFPAANK